MRRRVSVALKRVGWVEATQVGFSRLAPLWCRSRASPRSLAETHHCHATRTMMGFASAQPILRLLPHRHIPKRPIRLRVICVAERERAVGDRAHIDRAVAELGRG